MLDNANRSIISSDLLQACRINLRLCFSMRLYYLSLIQIACCISRGPSTIPLQMYENCPTTVSNLFYDSIQLRLSSSVRNGKL